MNHETSLDSSILSRMFYAVWSRFVGELTRGLGGIMILKKGGGIVSVGSPSDSGDL